MNQIEKEESNKFSIKHVSIEIIVFMIITIIFTAIFFQNGKHLWSLVIREQDIIFGSDTKDTLFFLQYPSFEDDARKHLLFFVTLNPIAKFIQFIMNVSTTRSIRFLLSFIASVNIGGSFLLLKKLTKSTLNALIFSVLYGISFSILVIYSIPETYSTSNLFILIYISALFAIRKNINFRNSILLTIISIIASLFNPVLLSLSVIHIFILFFQIDKMKWVLYSLSNLLLSFLLYFLTNLIIFGAQFLVFVDHYSSKYATLKNFSISTKVLNVISDFYFFSILSPHSCLTHRLDISDWHSYFHFPLKMVFISLFAIFLFYSIYIIIKKSYKKKISFIALLIWMILLSVFYVYFNPNEAMLYSTQTILPMMILLSQSFEMIEIKPIYKYAIFGLFLIFTAYTNFISYYNGIG